MKKVLTVVILIITGFLAILIFNTSRLKSKQRQYVPAEKIEINPQAADHLSEALQIKTISGADGADIDSLEFYRFSGFLQAAYPLIHARLTKTTVNSFGLLYQWKGTDLQSAPVVFAAHYDVVPADQSDSAKWLYLPFSGQIHENTIWGRGALDDKVSVVGIMEAVEMMLQAGFQPARTVYFAFGHDEEIGGINGAKAIVSHLKRQGVTPEFVLDEGLTITQGIVPGVLTDVALIGIAEKGFASVKLSIDLEGGHSSMPQNKTAIQAITRALTKLDENPFVPRISEPVHHFLDYAGPEMRYQEKLAFANRKLFRSVILQNYRQSPAGNALVQTTMVPTMIQGGIKDNVIPSNASATVNFRILPGTSVKEIVEHVRQSIDDDRIVITLGEFSSEPSPVSDPATKAYRAIEQSIKEIFPEVIAVPNLVLGATDGRYYYDICDNVYRFLPVMITQDNITAIHGENERITREDFENAIRFYRQLIMNINSSTLK